MSKPRWTLDEDGDPAWGDDGWHSLMPSDIAQAFGGFGKVTPADAKAAHAALAECIRKGEALDHIIAEVEWRATQAAVYRVLDGPTWRQVCDLIDREVNEVKP